MDAKAFWFRWVIANALGEMFGLGLTFAVAVLAISSLGDQNQLWAILVSFVIAVCSGAIEATIVGLAQWLVLRLRLPSISYRAWWLGTLVGALIAYILGYLPSTLMSLGQETSQAAQAPVTEPPQWIVLLMAAGLGAVGGAVLSFAQWLVLRKQVQGAGIWIPANMLAWLFGMPLIFWGIDASQRGQPLWQTVVILALVLLAAGAVVGAVHGAFLVRLTGGRSFQSASLA